MSGGGRATEGGDLDRLLTLNELPLYLRLAGGTAGRTLEECRTAWPQWRAELIARQPRQRPRTADLGLLNTVGWPLVTAPLAAAFLWGLDLRAGWRLAAQGNNPAHILNLSGVRLDPAADPLAAAVNTICAHARVLRPACVVGEALFWQALADRSVQALDVLGRASGEPQRALEWADRLVTLWPVPGPTRLRPEPEPMVRATCCYHFLNEQGSRCENCPATPGRAAAAR